MSWKIDVQNPDGIVCIELRDESCVANEVVEASVGDFGRFCDGVLLSISRR